MIGHSHDLPPRSNYFAMSAYVQQDLASGTLANRAGAPMVALTDECLIALVNTLRQEFAEDAPAVLQSLGTSWGRQAGEQLIQETGSYYGRPFMDLPLAMVASLLTEAFRHHGWGAFKFDFSHYAHGVLVVEAQEPFEGSIVSRECGALDELLSAFLAGMMSRLAGRELGCLQTDARGMGADASRFVITIPERLKGWQPGQAHSTVLAELCHRGMPS